jgi:hypothetical protein
MEFDARRYSYPIDYVDQVNFAILSAHHGRGGDVERIAGGDAAAVVAQNGV